MGEIQCRDGRDAGCKEVAVDGGKLVVADVQLRYLIRDADPARSQTGELVIAEVDVLEAGYSAQTQLAHLIQVQAKASQFPESGNVRQPRQLTPF